MTWLKLLHNLLALGFSVTDLARVFEVSTQAISQWVHGSKRPSDAHMHDLLALYALASEHVAAGGALSDFTTGEKWSRHAHMSVAGNPETAQEAFRLAFTPARLQAFKEGESLPPRERFLFHTKIHLAQALETMAWLATTACADPSAVQSAQDLDNLYQTAGALQQAIIALYLDRAQRPPAPQRSPAQEDPDAQKAP